MNPLCRVGIHAWPRYVNPYTQAPAPVRCLRCGKAQTFNDTVEVRGD